MDGGDGSVGSLARVMESEQLDMVGLLLLGLFARGAEIDRWAFFGT